MNSSCYQTAPNELGCEAGLSPIDRALFCSRVTSSPGEMVSTATPITDLFSKNP
jgi:hypothetical protein